MVYYTLCSVLLCSLMSCCLCSDEVQSEEVSPDGALTATSFVKDCGAATGFNTFVSVHPKVDRYKDEAGFVLVLRGFRRLRMEWKGPRQLSIQCPGCLRKDVFRQISVRDDLDISYAGS